MKISYNASAMLANNALTKNDNALARSLERLSSGLKIVHAKDNPSGLAMAKRMNAQLEGLSVATQNASDGVSIIETADGTMSEIQAMLQRLNELAVKGATSTLTDNDRQMIEQEGQQILSEIERVANTTEFNGQVLLDGTFDLKGYTDDIDVKVNYYGDGNTVGKYTIDSLTIAYDADGNIDAAASAFTSADEKFPVDAYISGAAENTITIKGSGDFELTLRIENEKTSFSNLSVDLTGIGAMALQIGSNEGQSMGLRIPTMSLINMGLSQTHFTKEDECNEANIAIKNAISYVSNARSRLGAYQNRLEHSINSLDVTSENMTGAYSRIMDVDMSEEMTEYSTLQVLTQASTSMVAQANERPSQVLQLLQ